MTPERWQEVDRVWHAVLARPEHERAAAVAELCAGDDELRREVESLLASLGQASAAGFGAVPASAVPRNSLVGRQLGCPRRRAAAAGSTSSERDQLARR
jgi:hypothetical protein